MKILLDTNVLLAAFMHNGQCYEVFLSVKDCHDVYYTAFLIKELKKILSQKFHYTDTAIRDVLSVIERFLNKGESANEVDKICRDSNDDQLLADAFVNGIDIIITGDKDLLHLNHYKGIKIVSPSSYLKVKK